MRVGYIGAGVMGCGIIKNLLNADVPVSFIVHRDRSRVVELTEKGAIEVEDLKTLAQGSDVIMMTVPDSSVVESLLEGSDGIGPHLRAGQIVIDMSTSQPESTMRLAGLLESRGIPLLDAPLTGSRPQAEAGTLNVMCGGEASVFEEIRRLFDAIATNVFHVGPVGSGNVIKLINNCLGQVAVAATCELLPLARKYDIDLQAMVDVISVSMGNSKAFQVLMPRVMNRDFGILFQQKYVRKDVRYVNECCRSKDVPTPMANALFALHEKVFAAGYGDDDFSMLAKYCEDEAGLKVE
jgi:3-hydroxyisobutyrate dehydrogenase-like beta-hydroxyacid dehydrogenase